MRTSTAAVAAIVVALSPLGGCGWGHGQSSNAEIPASDPSVKTVIQDESVHEPGDEYEDIDYGNRSEFWICLDLGSWPETAECISEERVRQDQRLEHAHHKLINELDGSSRVRAIGAHKSWRLLQDKDGSLEALLLDHLGPIGHFETSKSEVFRTCARASQLEGYLTAVVAGTPPDERPLSCATSRATCAGRRATDHHSRLIDAYERLFSLVDVDSRDQIEQSRLAWSILRTLDDGFERSIRYPHMDYSSNVRACDRADQIEMYIGWMSFSTVPEGVDGQ